MKKRLIYVIGGGDCEGYSNWMNIDGYTTIEKANFCLGVGGSDIGNKYYNQPNSGYLGINAWVDNIEFEDYQKAIKLGKPMVCICKGSQWLAALAGGAVFQHVQHPYRHEIKTFDGKTLITNSLHHNMADLSNLKENIDYKLLAWAENLSPFHINGWNKSIECGREPEVVYYPKIKGLGIQPHPEMMFLNAEFKPMLQWYSNILTKFLADNL